MIFLLVLLCFIGESLNNICKNEYIIGETFNKYNLFTDWNFNINSPTTMNDMVGHVIFDLNTNGALYLRLSEYQNMCGNNKCIQFEFDIWISETLYTILSKVGDNVLDRDGIASYEENNLRKGNNVTFWIAWNKNENSDYLRIGYGNIINQNINIDVSILDNFNFNINYIYIGVSFENALVTIYDECPTTNPTKMPTLTPTLTPTKIPSVNPTSIPSLNPTKTPTLTPTDIPSLNPTNMRSLNPTNIPSLNPIKTPTLTPTNIPSLNPTLFPTKIPTNIPSLGPTQQPTQYPTSNPTNIPSFNPSQIPSSNPTREPTLTPIEATNMPSFNPNQIPATNSTQVSTEPPTAAPTQLPTKAPTAVSYEELTQEPTFSPNVQYSDNETELWTPNVNDTQRGIKQSRIYLYIIFAGSLCIVILILACMLRYAMKLKHLNKSATDNNDLVFPPNVPKIREEVKSDSIMNHYSNSSNIENRNESPRKDTNAGYEGEFDDELNKKNMDYQENAVRNISYYMDVSRKTSTVLSSHKSVISTNINMNNNDINNNNNNNDDDMDGFVFIEGNETNL